MASEMPKSSKSDLPGLNVDADVHVNIGTGFIEIIIIGVFVMVIIILLLFFYGGRGCIRRTERTLTGYRRTNMPQTYNQVVYSQPSFDPPSSYQPSYGSSRTLPSTQPSSYTTSSASKDSSLPAKTFTRNHRNVEEPLFKSIIKKEGRVYDDELDLKSNRSYKSVRSTKSAMSTNSTKSHKGGGNFRYHQ